MSPTTASPTTSSQALPPTAGAVLATFNFDFEGLRIAYDHAGAGAGPPIVFLHNLGSDRSIWAAQLEAFKATNSVYALDWIGYGDSSLPDDGYTLDLYLRLLTSFIDSHQLQRVTLVGNCFGSAMSLMYAQRFPSNVHALVLVNPLTAATMKKNPSGRIAQMLPAFSLRILATALQLPEAFAAKIVRDQLGEEDGGQAPPATIAALQRRWTEPRRLLPFTEILPELRRLAALDAFEPDGSFPPITTIWGLKNRVLSADAGETLNANLKPRRAIFLPRCGHLPMLEDPESVTAQIQFAASKNDSRL